MTATAFVQAIQEMPGLLPAMVERLTALAPHLTDEERQQTVDQLTPLNADIVKKEQKAQQILDEAVKDVQALKRKEVPKLHQMIDEEEHGRAEGILDDQMKKL